MAERRSKDKGKEKIVEELVAKKPDPEHLCQTSAVGWAKDKGKLMIEKLVAITPDSDYEGFIEYSSYHVIMAKRKAKDKGKEKIVEELRATKPDPEHLSWILAERWAKDKSKLKIEEPVTTKPDSEHEGFIEATPVSSWPFVPPNMESNLGIELPPNAKLLMDLEAADILQRVQKYLRSLNDPRLKIPQALVSALQYLQDVVRYFDVTTVIRSLVGLKECNGAIDWEICMIANICPKTVEEAYALIPSLKAKKDQIDEALDILLLTLALMKEKDFEFMH